jgi:2,4-diaminopentanoate dehydrogenase
MPYRVIQWATGHVGKTAIRHFHANPAFDLVGVLVTNPKKVGADAGAIARIGPIGLAATDDVEAIVAMAADCVHYAPLVHDVAMICRLLRSGKNVVSPLGPFYPTDYSRADFAAIEAAARDGGVSFHGSGIHPGFAGDLLPLTLARIMERIDRIHVTEVIDQLANPSNYIEFFGFGRTPADLLANPGRSPEAPLMFAESMAMVVEGLGKTIERLATSFEVAVATQDIPHPRGIVRAGTVAGQHYEWSAIVDGKPLITFHCFWKLGDTHLEPNWDCGDTGYRIVIEGEPPMELTMAARPRADGYRDFLGLPWTAMAGVNIIPALCAAPPGIVTHFDLGVVGIEGLARG